MADIYVHPQKENIEKLRDYLDDPFLWSIVHGVIKNLNSKKDFGDCVSLWENLTRQMFKNYPAILVYAKVDNALAEASDEQWFENKYPNFIFQEKKNQNRIIKSRFNRYFKDIKISQLASDKYGLEIKKNKAICPFHEDTDPSLSFNDDRGSFYCFGCHAKGDIVEFIRKMETLNEVKNGKGSS